MSLTAKKIVSEAMSLPAPVRAYVAERLIESLDSENPAEVPSLWCKEIEKRCKELDDGLVDLIPAKDVFASALDKLS